MAALLACASSTVASAAAGGDSSVSVGFDYSNLKDGITTIGGSSKYGVEVDSGSIIITVNFYAIARTDTFSKHSSRMRKDFHSFAACIGRFAWHQDNHLYGTNTR